MVSPHQVSQVIFPKEWPGLCRVLIIQLYGFGIIWGKVLGQRPQEVRVRTIGRVGKGLLKYFSLDFYSWRPLEVHIWYPSIPLGRKGLEPFLLFRVFLNSPGILGPILSEFFFAPKCFHLGVLGGLSSPIWVLGAIPG